MTSMALLECIPNVYTIYSVFASTVKVLFLKKYIGFIYVDFFYLQKEYDTIKLGLFHHFTGIEIEVQGFGKVLQIVALKEEDWKRHCIDLMLEYLVNFRKEIKFNKCSAIFY